MGNGSIEMQSGNAAGKRGVRKEAIVCAAAELFTELGIKKTSIAKLMDKAQLTRELFYYYFRDKDELISEVIDLYVNDVCRIIDEWIVRAQETIDPSTDFPGQITLLVKALRHIVNGIDESHEGRLAAIMESGYATDATRRVTIHLVGALLETESYRYFAREHGNISELQLELVLVGIEGLALAYPDMSDVEVAAAAYAALCGGVD